jgi:hypothetical protein
MKERKVNILCKRTFFEGCYLELYKRNDGGHRLKYVSPNGDEVTLNLDTKLWAKPARPETLFDMFVSPDRPEGFNGVGSELDHNISLWTLLINCDHYITNVVTQLGAHLKSQEPDEPENCTEDVPVKPKRAGNAKPQR